MRAFYNEIESYPARWLRNLSDRSLINPGYVEERSITALAPSDVYQYTQAHFFAGIGVWSHALRLAGWPDDEPVWTGSCPCQPFSQAGRGLGFDDERHLWPVWFRLIRECRPPVVFGEQVASPPGRAWLDLVQSDLQDAGYAVGAANLCAAGLGAPHIRQRLYFVAIADSARLQEFGLLLQRGGSQQTVSQTAGRSETLGVGDPGVARGWRDAGTVLGAQREGATEGRVARSEPHVSIAPGTAHELVDADGQRLEEWAGERQDGDARHAASERAGDQLGGLEYADGGRQSEATLGGCVGGMADTAGERSERINTTQAWQSQTSRGGEVGGFWGDADWIDCRDDKRRPIEPGTFPLAHGAPARVGKLRAYGNAIVPQVAATFIRAAREAIYGV